MDALKDLFFTLLSFCMDVLKSILNWFLALSVLNKAIVLNSITAFLAVILPMAKYYIFESWSVINNPLAVYLILIVLIMFVTIFFRGIPVLAVRVIINVWYLIAVIVIYAGHSISKAPYNLSIGYLFNVIAPLVYLALSLLVFLSGDSE